MSGLSAIARLLLALGISASVTAGAHAAPEDAFGNWKDTEKGSTVKVYACKAGICASLLTVTGPNGKDVNNPEPKLRDRPLVGLVFLQGGKKSGDNKWDIEALYNREDGKTYKGYITVVNKNELKLEGCVAFGLLCKSRTWTRLP